MKWHIQFITTLIVTLCSCTPNSVTNDDNLSSTSSTLATTIVESQIATTIKETSTKTTDNQTTLLEQTTTTTIIEANSTNTTIVITEICNDILHDFSLNDIPPFNDTAYIEVNNNTPFFTDITITEPFELYTPLDELGRCTVAFANICPEIMPTEKRGSIGMVKPSGWQTTKYNDLIDGNYLYNRCHLIAYELAGENANTLNLITGTRYLNIQGMLHFENKVADYVKYTGNHVLYRVTPIFDRDNLVANGVLMEGYSVEDQGEGIQYCVYCYNVQPGIGIDYSNGNS